MSTLLLIRHGQASFGADDYDVLSNRGVEQSRRLGAFWAARGLRLDALYTGPRKRQVDTACHALDAARQAGVTYPEPTQLAELDEYPAMELLRHWMPIVATEDPELGTLMASPGKPGGKQEFTRAFLLLLRKWARGEIDTGHLESFAGFSARVRRGLCQIMDSQGRQKSVAVFTSGGPIAIAMQAALGLAEDMTMQVAWVIGNASISEFRYRDSRDMSLVSFNAMPHLPGDALVTYR